MSRPYNPLKKFNSRTERANAEQAVKLRTMRRTRGIKATWVAQMIGVSRQYLSMLEAGKRKWTPQLITNFLRVIGVTQPKAKE